MKATKTVIALSVLLGVAGCQSTPSSESNKSETNQEGVELLASAFEASQAQYLHWETQLQNVADFKIYAPENYSELNSAWKDASEIYQELRAEPNKILASYSVFSSETYAEALTEQLTIVDSNYQALTALKVKADAILADAIAQVQYLDEIGANKLYSRQYKALYNAYKSLFEYVVVDELEDAQEAQVEFINRAKKLEIKVVHKRFIEPLKLRLAHLRKNDLDEIAVNTYATASTQVKLAENTVMANPRNLKVIEDAVAKANFELEHVKNVAHQIKLLVSIEDEHFEPAVLEIENRLLAISKAVDGSDYRDQVLRVQADKILLSVENLHSEDQTAVLQKQLKALNSELADLKIQNERNITLLAEQVEQKELLSAQVTRSEEHIQSLKELVANFKSQAANAKLANPENSIKRPEKEELSKDNPVTEKTILPETVPETVGDAENRVNDVMSNTSEVIDDVVASSI